MVFGNAIPLVDYNRSSAKLCAFVDCSPGPDDVGHIVGAMDGKHNDRGDHLEHTKISDQDRGGHNEGIRWPT